MEEKKTKKMTKAEAFEWLDGKKIRTEGNHEKVLRKLFDLGFVWKNLRDTRVDLGWQSGEVYGLTISDEEVAWWTTPHLFETYGADAVTAEEILSIEIVEEEKDDIFAYPSLGEAQRYIEVLRKWAENLDASLVVSKSGLAVIREDLIEKVQLEIKKDK